MRFSGFLLNCKSNTQRQKSKTFLRTGLYECPEANKRCGAYLEHFPIYNLFYYTYTLYIFQCKATRIKGLAIPSESSQM